MSTDPKKQIDLHLNSGAGNDAGAQDGARGGTQTGVQAENRPVMGWFAVGFAVLGIVSSGVVFVPLGVVCSIIALFMGQGMWAFIGLGLSVVGLFSSPLLLGILGLGAIAAYFGIPM